VARLGRWSTALRTGGVDQDVEGRRRVRPKMASVEAAAERLKQYNPRLSIDHARELAGTFTEDAGDGSGSVVWRFDPLHKTPAAKPYLFEEARAIWRSLDMPVLSLFGSNTPWISPELADRHGAIEDLTIGTVEDAGHNIHHDQPEVVARAITQWMSRERSTSLPAGIRSGMPLG
jgi:pimeloyl-ACP methyl ester carboxylesterase